MWFQIVMVLFYLQAGSYARSIDSLLLDKLITSGIRSHRPVVIIVDRSKNLGVHFEDDTTYESYEDNNVLFSGALRARDNRNCKRFLREKLEGKCSDEAACMEIEWKLVNEICDGDEPTQKSDEAIQATNEAKKRKTAIPKPDEDKNRKTAVTKPDEDKKRKTAAPKPDDVKVYMLMKKQQLLKNK
ncbi:uncharacterized protein LOC134794628 [Cydia splendana]|uniref:uncharacterized protein LOC134794628 n=1 Tax=Cydia splendana TaxID=1100963 RepID=UPI00300D2C9B